MKCIKNRKSCFAYSKVGCCLDCVIELQGKINGIKWALGGIDTEDLSREKLIEIIDAVQLVLGKE